jgi:hypothetical protein
MYLTAAEKRKDEEMLCKTITFLISEPAWAVIDCYTDAEDICTEHE